MCGIAGIYQSNESPVELMGLGKDIAAAMHHRGPDDAGVVTLTDANQKNTLLIHTRLSIIDLSDAAHQPMQNGDGSIYLVFNGEIYNYSEIRDDLKKRGVCFRSNSDTETLLKAYEEWGVSCFSRFIGMWACAIWDKKQNRFILCRDRFGIKPLYYSYKNNTLYFASQPDLVMKASKAKPVLNPMAVSDYFSYRYCLNNESFFSGVKTLEPGSMLICTPEQIKKEVYWKPLENTASLNVSEAEATEKVKDLLASSIKYRMISDVPFGAYLSGGADSSIMVANMARLNRQSIRTYTIGFPEAGYNEFEYADRMAKHAQTNHTAITLDPSAYIQSLEKLIQLKGSPLAVPNEVALYILSKELRKNITVVLSGEGADEVFGGYGRIFRSAYDYARVKGYKDADLPSLLKTNLLKKYNQFNWKNEAEHFVSQYSYVALETKHNLFSSEYKKSLSDDMNRLKFFESVFNQLNDATPMQKYMSVFQRYHLPGLLSRLDSATMAASVEGRVPFVDHRLVEYVNQLPLSYKLAWAKANSQTTAQYLNSDQISEEHDVPKYLLKKAYETEVPNSILYRKKMGFPVPLHLWLSGPLKEYGRDILLSKTSRLSGLLNMPHINSMFETLGSETKAARQNGLLLWMLVNLEQWMQLYRVSI